MKNINVVFMGTPDFAVPILKGLIENYNVVAVVSQPDKKVGRHQEIVNTPIKKVALENNIVCIQPENIKDKCEEVLAFNPDIIITCAYGQIIPKNILDYPRFGCINVHASLLPKLRGGAPIHKAIIDGYFKTGITIMYMDVKMDSGDIISQAETEILDSDNLESLHDRLSLIGRDLLLSTLPSIFEEKNMRIRQDENAVTYAWNIKRNEERIDFNKTRREIFNLIRGLSPVPGACFLFDNKEFKVYSSIISENVFSNKSIGEITGLYKDGIGVKCGDGEIIFTLIKPYGKNKMTASSYINGIQNRNDIIGKVLK